MNASQPRRAEADGGAPRAAPAFAVDPARELAALLQLGRRAREALSVEALGFVMVNETRHLYGFRQAALARANLLGRSLPAEVLAVSGLPQPDVHAPYVQWLAQAFRAVAQTPRTAAFVLRPGALPETVAREWSAWLPAQALVVPLAGPDAEVLAWLVLARDDAWSERDVALADELGPALRLRARAVPQGYVVARPVAGACWSGRHRWLLLAALLLVAMIPVRLTVLAPAEVVPSEPFLVRAPLEGVIDHFNVRPNQSVAAGDPLFDLDTTTLRAHSSVARKAYDVASEEYRQAAQGP